MHSLVLFVEIEYFAPRFSLWKLEILSHIESKGKLQGLQNTNARFASLITHVEGVGRKEAQVLLNLNTKYKF